MGNLAATTFGDGTRQLRLPDAVGNLFTTAERRDRRYGPAGQLLEAKGTRYAYNALGNLSSKTTARGQQWHYAWNAAGYLAEVVRPDGGVVRFVYDALGRRVSKSYKGKVTRWVWDGDKPLHEWTSLEVGAGVGAVEDVVTWLFDEDDSFTPAAKLTDQSAYSVVADHLGTPLELYDGQGQQTWQAQLDSYGAVRQGTGQAQECPFRYQGQYEDAETGLYYNRFRYFDPHAGQYISQDPTRLNGSSFSLYSYVHDPLLWSDVFGLNPIPLNRRAQFRAAKRAAGIPTSAQHTTHKYVYDGTSENRTVYEFDVDNRKKYVILHEEDKLGRGPHFHGADDVKGDAMKPGRYNQYNGHFPEDKGGFTSKGKGCPRK